MKEIRPSTWVTLIVLALMIFVPAFFIDVDTLQMRDNGQGLDNTIKPINPLGGPDNKPENKPANEPEDKPPANEPPDNESSALD